MNKESREPPVTMSEEAVREGVVPKPKIGRLIPPFELQSITGEKISPWMFKEKKNLLIVFFDPRNSADLEALAEIDVRYHNFADANTEILAIASGPMDELKECVGSLHFKFSLLSDSYNTVRKHYDVSESTLFVADKFGELKSIDKISGDLDAVLNSAESTVELIELECPECGVTSWPE